MNQIKTLELTCPYCGNPISLPEEEGENECCCQTCDTFIKIIDGKAEEG